MLNNVWISVPSCSWEWRALIKYDSLHEVFLSKLKGCWKGQHHSAPSKIQCVGQMRSLGVWSNPSEQGLQPGHQPPWVWTQRKVDEMILGQIAGPGFAFSSESFYLSLSLMYIHARRSTVLQFSNLL